MRAGLEFLVRTQRPDGDWDEPWHTWVVHHDGLFWRDSLLRLIFPLQAMGRFLKSPRRSLGDVPVVLAATELSMNRQLLSV